MKRPKLILTLERFDGWKWRNCRIFLESGLSGLGEEGLRLYDYCRTSLEADEEWDKSVAWRRVFGEAVYEDSRIRYLMTDLNRAVEAFLVWEQLGADKVGRDLYLMEAYRTLGLDGHFRKTMERAEKGLEKQDLRDGDYFLRRYRLEEAAARVALEQKNRDANFSMRGLSDTLDAFFAGTKLKYAAEMLNRANILGLREEPGLWSEVMAFAEGMGESAPPMVEIYQRINLSLAEAENEAHYEALLELLDRHGDRFSRVELGNMYGFALNYCIKKLNEGQVHYQEQLFELYVILVEKGLLFDGDYLPPQHFKNICTLALRLQRYAWTEDFIGDYWESVQPGHAQNAKTYNMAFLHFARKEYGKALRLLQRVEFTDVFYHLDSKALLLRTYYELDEIEPLLSLLDTFRVYLKRNTEISAYQKRVYLNLVRFVKKLIRLRLGARITADSIREEILHTQEIADRGWLLAKLED